METLIFHCGALIAQHSGLLLPLFLAGLLGGFTHCAGMCGPFVASQACARAARGSDMLARLSGAALIPYHLGRMTTYAGLGVVSALLSRQIMGSPVEQGISSLLLALAGTIFIVSALPSLKARLSLMRSGWLLAMGERLGRMAAPLMGRPTGFQGYTLGLLLGFLPCGLVFAALMAVAATGNPLVAGAGMVLFTLGTIPALFLVAAGSGFAYRRWPGTVQRIARGIMVMNGIGLFVIAGTLWM